MKNIVSLIGGDKETIFVTTDGVVKVKGDSYFFIRKGFPVSTKAISTDPKFYSDGEKRFHCEEAAQRYLDGKKETVIRRVLFTTDDNVEIRDNDKYYCINAVGRISTHSAIEGLSYKSSGSKRFSSKEAAQKHIDKEAERLKQPIVFVTHDDVPIRKGDKYWVGRRSAKSKSDFDRITCKIGISDHKYVTFFTEAALDNWLSWNAPVLSLNEIGEIFVSCKPKNADGGKVEKLLKKAQSKIK